MTEISFLFELSPDAGYACCSSGDDEYYLAKDNIVYVCYLRGETEGWG